MTRGPKLLLPLLIAFMPLAGCGDSEDATEKRLEKYARQHGADVDVDYSQEHGVKSVTMKGEDGETKTAFGENVGLPDGFPGDIAVYPGLKIFTSSTMPNGFLVQGHTGDGVDAVGVFFRDRMTGAGWSLAEQTESPGMHSYSFRKDGRTATVVLVPGDTTTVQIVALSES
ncbi:MAG: hypothetical protein GC201_16135 [Alphaproteobacteria bacterium]|nr:hypothetical protein [Alphaproteobacteria bacterium]